MQPIDPITDLDPATRVTLHALGLHLTFTIDPSMMMVAIFIVFILTSCGIATCRPGPYRRSNMRATLGSCPPSSASAAESSPTTDHAALTASKNETPVSTPEPRATPRRAASVQHTEPGPKRYSRRRRCAPSAADHQRQVIH